MLARVCSAAILGIDAYTVDVEVDISNGLPSFATVGLRESVDPPALQNRFGGGASNYETKPISPVFFAK